MSTRQTRVLIVGCGVAGLSCAMYLNNADIPFEILGDYACSSIAGASRLQNYPGAGEVNGYELLERMADGVAGRILPYDCIRLTMKDGVFDAEFSEGKHILSEYAVVATGTLPRLLGLKNEAYLLNEGLHVCAVCDGDFYRGKSVAVVGGGNTALQDAIYLSRICKSVTIIHRRDAFRADEALVKQMENTETILRMMQTEVKAIDKVEGGIQLSLEKQGEAFTEMFDGVFYAIGRIPNNTVVYGLPVELDDGGYILTKDNETSVHNLFACGDVNASNVFKQAVTASADGVNTAYRILRRIM